MQPIPKEPRPPFPARFCEECGVKFFPKMMKQIYHIPICQKRAAARALAGGFKLYPLIMSWRIDRGRSALSKLTMAADDLAADEREIRRKRAEKIATYK